MNKSRFYVPAVIILTLALFFNSFIFKGLFPIPSDLIVGLYHPFRDQLADQYPRGVPFKNFLLLDPVTQQIPWRNLTVDEVKGGSAPLWNPYQMAGYPLLGNVQSAPFYPLNILFLVLPFIFSWSLIIISQPLLAMIFMYLYLRQQRVSREAGLFGSIIFAFSGFMMSWLEWGTIGSTALWAPLMLYSFNRVVLEKKKVIPSVILLVSIVFSYLAGHTQTFFYEIALLAIYAVALFVTKKTGIKNIILTGIAPLLGFILLSPIIWTQLQFINYSARLVDLDWHIDGWFIPLQNAMQFLAPNFFGNPATGNYWGVWNYGEFIGYVGILPLVFVIYALISGRRKLVYFFTGVLIASILLAFKTPLATLPFQLQIPFLSTAQPTRLLFLIDLSLAVLAAFGLDRLNNAKKKIIIIPVIILGFLIAVFLSLNANILGGGISLENLAVAKRNLIFPIGFSIISVLVFIPLFRFTRYKRFIPFVVIFITIFDLFLVSQKYTPFTKGEYFYPETKLVTYLKDETGINRVMTLSREILHPNIATKYQIQVIEGYDPLYLLRFGELLAASKRMKPDISPPFGFSRIVTTDQYKNPIINLLGVKYIVSLNEIDDTNLEKVFEQGETKVYLNKKALPRTFFVKSVTTVSSKEDSIKFLFSQKDLLANAVIESDSVVDKNYSEGIVAVDSYKPNEVILRTTNKEEGFLLLTDSYYPTWSAYIDGKKTTLYLTDYSFRGIVVPKGDHRVVFTNSFIKI